MTTQSSQAQSEQTQAQKLTPDFSHRLSASNSNEAILIDSVGLATDRALGVLHLILMDFYDDGGDRLSDALMAGAIDAAINEIQDVKAIVRAYCLADSANKRA
jgi:hypothetical protein